jgi:hypothetical protein
MMFFSFALPAQDTNAFDKYFSQYVNDQNFSVVYISPKLFQMIDKLNLEGIKDADDKIVLDIARDLRALRILSTDKDVQKYYKDAKAKINPKEYEVLMTVRDKNGSNVEFLVREEAGSGGNIISELLMLSNNEKEFVMLSFLGKIDVEKIFRLARSIEYKKTKEE